MKMHKCDLCGRCFDEYDNQEQFGFHYKNVGYGSQYDGCTIDIDMCCDCFDKMMVDYLIPKLKFRKTAIRDLRDYDEYGVEGTDYEN